MMKILSYENKVIIYNRLLKSILEDVCNGLESILKLALEVVDTRGKNFYPNNIQNKLECAWGKKIIHNDKQIYMYIYIDDKNRFYKRMGESLFLESHYPVFDCFINRILDRMEIIIKNDLESHEIQVSFIDSKEALLMQAVTDFFFQEKLPDINSISYLSSLTYEKDTCGGSILFAKKERIINKYTIIELDSNLKFNLDNYRIIRKLLETVRKEGYLFVDIESKDIIGIIYEMDLNKSDEYSYVIYFLGHMHWIAKKNLKIAVEYKDGRYFITDDFNKELYLNQLKQKCKDVCDVNRIKKIIEAASKQLHGTILVFSKCAQTEAERLCKINRGILIKPSDVNDRNGQIESITSIDGAVFFDSNCVCYAFGVILDGPANLGEISRGARYNSALAYINWQNEILDNWAIAVVISEDGMVNII